MSKKIHEYEIRKGIIKSDNGLPHAPRWFTDGRLIFEVTQDYIGEIVYMAKNKMLCNTVFLQDLFNGLVNYIYIDEERYAPKLDKCSIYPFGVKYEFTIEGIKFEYILAAVKERLVTAIGIKNNKGKKIKFELEFFDSYRLYPQGKSDFRYMSDGYREWKEFKLDNNMLIGGFTDTFIAGEVKKLDLCIKANFNFKYSRKGLTEFHKNILTSDVLENGLHAFYMCFDNLEDNLDVENALREQYLRYNNAYKNSPILECDNKSLEKFYEITPVYYESLKLKEYPGALRAKTTNYWMWGWDTITYVCAVAYMGDLDFMKENLEFMGNTLSDGCIPMLYNQDWTYTQSQAMPTNSLYFILLYEVFCMDRDIDILRKYYPVAKKLFNNIISMQNKKTGLIEGSSLFPDHPDLFLETGHDISSFNNTLYYAAFRCLEYISVVLEDSKMSDTLNEILNCYEKQYFDLFYVKEDNFMASSIDADTLEKRKSYNINGIKLEHAYFMDLIEDAIPNTIKYIESKLLTKNGLRMLDKEDELYDSDANQLHYWFPVNGEYFLRSANILNRRDLIDKWIGWVSYWTDQLMCPEGISIHAEYDTPPKDGWTTLNGSFQAFVMRPWYAGILQNVIGINMEDGEITVCPCDGDYYHISNLKCRQGNLDVEIKGSGRYIRSINVNGIVLNGTNKIPSDMLKKHNKIVITRTNRKRKICIWSAVGGEITKYKGDSFLLRGAGRVNLKIMANVNIDIYVDGKRQECIDKNGFKKVGIYFDKYEDKFIEVKARDEA